MPREHLIASIEKSDDPGVKIHIQGERAIDERTYSEFVDAYTVVTEFKREHLLGYFRVLHNHGDFIDYFDTVRTAFRIQGRPTDIDEVLAQINRLLMNFIWSVAAFQEQSEFALERRYGQQSTQARAFKEHVRHLRTREFSVEFYFQLRDYTLHRNVPIHIPDIGSRAGEDGSVEHRFVLLVDGKRLLTEKRKWGAITAELGRRAPRLDLLEHMPPMMGAIKSMHTKAVEIHLAELRAARDTMLRIVPDLRARQSPPFVITFPEEPNAMATRMSFFEFPMAMLRIIDTDYSNLKPFALM